jgi:hypothetical protein
MFALFDKIDISQIIKDHIDTLRDFANGKTSWWDLLLFFGLPLLASSLILFGMGTLIDRASSNILITSLSVFSGLLLNLLMLIYDLMNREEHEAGAAKKPSVLARLLREIFANLSYSILVSVFCVAILLIAYLDIRSGVFLRIFSFVVYFLVIQFVLTMFMVLKRVHVLMSLRITNPAPKPPPKPHPTPPSLRKGVRRAPRKSLP